MKLPGLLRQTDFWLAFCLLILSFIAVRFYLENRSLAHQARVENCRSLNELRRDLFVTATDLNLRPALADRFLPTTDCENLP